LVSGRAPLLAPNPAAHLPRPLSGTVRIVTATHGHPDHVGGAAATVQRDGAEIHVPAMTLAYLDGVHRPRTPAVAKLVRTRLLPARQRA
jgi:glyoxylase-like metal-dependent hydrolase (beta-lactamase superfamily II)